jgi:hypothetical protein
MREYHLTKDSIKDRLDCLLKRHNLTLKWLIIFNRWNLHVVDSDGRELWRRRGMNLKAYRDELIEFLENYERRE